MMYKSDFFDNLLNQIDEVNNRTMNPTDKANLYRKLNEIAKIESQLVTFRATNHEEYTKLYNKKENLTKEFYELLNQFPVVKQIKM